MILRLRCSRISVVAGETISDNTVMGKHRTIPRGEAGVAVFAAIV